MYKHEKYGPRGSQRILFDRYVHKCVLTTNCPSRHRRHEFFKRPHRVPAQRARAGIRVPRRFAAFA